MPTRRAELTTTVFDGEPLAPAPSRLIPLGFNATFTPEEAEKLLRGYVPESMDEKWLIAFQDDWLRFHRGWTGFLIFALRLVRRKRESGLFVAESWMNGDPDQHGGSDLEQERNLLRFLIDALLLGKPEAALPARDAITGRPGSLARHVAVGAIRSKG